MIIGVLKETFLGEHRACLLPDNVKSLTLLGAQVLVESALGQTIHVPDQEYQKSGASLADKTQVLSQSDLVVRVRKSPLEDIAKLKKGSIHISLFDPYRDPDLVKVFAQASVSAISLEMIPRTTLAQKMDALSSQANLAGYAAVIIAANKIRKIFPLMMTPSGTIPAARVFIIGAGVAGLQAIATAKRLGAIVEAFDTRPAVEEQVKSLGARFVKVDLGETGQTEQGYAKQLTEEQLLKQRQGMIKVMRQSDVVITTAQVFGKKAPRVITREMIKGMKPGSVIIDMAIETGGNVEGSLADQEVLFEGVKVLGMANLPSQVALDASQMFGNNLKEFILHGWDRDEKKFKLSIDDPLIKSCLVTHQGQIMQPVIG